MIIPECTFGSLSVLNVGKGDVEITFDKDDPLEIERAKRIIQDMLRRGYSLFIEVDGKLKPVKKFDPAREVYKIADGALYVGDQMEAAGTGKRGRPKKTVDVPMRKTRATGVAPTAGG